MLHLYEKYLLRNPALPLPLFNPPTPVFLDRIHVLFEIRPNFETQEFQDSVKCIFQSVGLAPLITSTDQNGTFVSNQDIHTLSHISNTVLKVKCDYEKHDLHFDSWRYSLGYRNAK